MRLIRKANGGKASALNVGYGESTSDVLVCLDTDTMLHPDAERLMLRHFDSGKVGAVAGNVRVGNSDNILTRWRSLE